MNRRRITDEEIDEAIRKGVVLLEDEETSEMVTRMEREADEEIAASTVTLRWGKDQVDVVKRAAGIIGVPYQTYLKQVVFRQAVEDIARAQVLEKQPKAPRKRKSHAS
jgi:predicted DNA binding CopG/RHH family protein